MYKDVKDLDLNTHFDLEAFVQKWSLSDIYMIGWLWG